MYKWMICLLLLWQAGVSAQSKTLVIHSHLGINIPRAADLNGVLEAAGFQKIAPVYFARGAGAYKFFPATRLTTFLQFNSYTGTREEGQRSSAVRGTQVGSALGFSFGQTDKALVTPLAGLAYSFWGVRAASQVAPGNTAVEAYLQGSANQHHLATNQWLGQVGLQIAGTGKARLLRNMAIGMRAVYSVPLSGTKWKSNNTNLAGGPGINSGGLQVSAIIGWVQ